MRIFHITFLLFLVVLTSACVNSPPAHDYSNFRTANPQSILILPPINNSTEVIAPYSVMSQVVAPIAESGFYAFPVALVYQTFKNNGLTVANDIHAVSIAKLHEIFGADAALYINIKEYGTSYVVLSSNTVVHLTATLVDLKTGDILWQDEASASSAETRGNSGGNIIGILVQAAVNQVIETISDTGFDIARIATSRLISADSHNGLLYGPRSDKYGLPVPSEK